MILEIIGNAFLYNTSLTGTHSGTKHKQNNRDVWGWGWMGAGMVGQDRHIFSTLFPKSQRAITRWKPQFSACTWDVFLLIAFWYNFKMIDTKSIFSAFWPVKGQNIAIFLIFGQTLTGQNPKIGPKFGVFIISPSCFIHLVARGIEVVIPYFPY